MNVKKNVDEICKISSTDKQMNLNYDLFNNKVKELFKSIHNFILTYLSEILHFQIQLDYSQHLRT